MQGFLNKKKDQKEKWKSQYFVLKQEGADCHMYIYEHPKRTKPKGMVFCNQISFNSEAFFRLVSVRKSAAYLILECQKRFTTFLDDSETVQIGTIQAKHIDNVFLYFILYEIYDVKWILIR